MADIPNILTPLKVDVMSEERLEELAAESEYVQSERAELQNEADILRKGLDICKKYRPREATGKQTSVPWLIAAYADHLQQCCHRVCRCRRRLRTCEGWYQVSMNP